MHDTFSDRLNRAMKAYPNLPPGVELGDKWLADQIGAKRTTVRWWRQGREPALEWIERIAGALYVEPCWLAFGIGAMRPFSAAHAIEAAEVVARQHQHPERKRRQAE